jgi:hypothetical protein
MNELDRKYFDANAEFAQQHGKTAKTVEFFIGKEGVVPLFMDSGSLNDAWAMQERTATEVRREEKEIEQNYNKNRN